MMKRKIESFKYEFKFINEQPYFEIKLSNEDKKNLIKLNEQLHMYGSKITRYNYYYQKKYSQTEDLIWKIIKVFQKRIEFIEERIEILSLDKTDIFNKKIVCIYKKEIRRLKNYISVLEK